MADVQLSKNFKLSEMVCNHCGKMHPTGMDKELIHKLQVLRDLIGVPIRVNSGYRCPYWNRTVGGVKNSYHLKGMAADIAPIGMSYDKFYKECCKLFPDGGVGRYPPSRHKSPFVHVNTTPNGVRRRWEG